MFYLINKEIGMTSFQVIRELRKKLNIKKMGHIGTLDPLASGLMLIATEQSTKLLSFLNSEKKGYVFRVELDGKTESLDLETPVQIIDTNNLHIPSKEVIEYKILTTTEQIPPKFSAIHINGKRAYKLARKDRDFDIPSRKIQVYEAKVIHINPTSITAEITISSGGYIRSFAPVFGEWCGIDGGYISLLHRNKLFLKDSILTENHSQKLQDFDKNIFIPEHFLFPNWLFFSIDNTIIQEHIHRGIIPDITILENEIKKNKENFDKNPKLTDSDFFLKKILQETGQKILLTFQNNYSSLLEVTENGLKITRNDVTSHT